ncbi:MAG: branched-chain amino acid transaminase [Thaumarchaeota archaeon]|nr:branched-chain amino acid transaminase [Nitrososphaerota archaeon]
MKKTDKIWLDGDLVPWEEAKIHVMTHSLHYGSAMFEGIRCYNTENGTMIFRLDAHNKRFYNSAKIYGMSIPYTPEEVASAIKDTIRGNKINECYIRPILFYGWDEVGVSPKGNQVHLAIAVWPWLPYLGEEGLQKGVRCKISSWARIDPRSMPTMAKAAANYANSILAKIEAQQLGYDEAILLNGLGMVAEGTGENIFIVKDDALFTPPHSSGALPGITRDSIIQVGKDLGYKVEQRDISRSELLLAEEAFLTGTAAEVTPIREIDGRSIGNGARGPITEKIQKKFFDIVRGKDPKYSEWLEPL